jgi:hypothetical protein
MVMLASLKKSLLSNLEKIMIILHGVSSSMQQLEQLVTYYAVVIERL